MFTLNFLQQSVRDGFKHNKTTNGLKWTTKTAAGTVLKCNSEENKAMTEAILIYVKGQHQTVEEGVIRCGIETYFNSVKQKEIMELTGKKEEHNRKMVLYGRKHRLLPLRLNMNQPDDRTFSTQDFRFAFVIAVVIYMTLLVYKIYRGAPVPNQWDCYDSCDMSHIAALHHIKAVKQMSADLSNEQQDQPILLVPPPPPDPPNPQ
ncbi:unnamed protein product [Mytilus edulis]|uniref:Uncharacterized protein n=1 Tax=Mytilus edulis TaxID=6550 RepID=A0A8S3UTP2_MYTED|nr:unnamed protein product [Mytilus edulis]